MESLPNEIIHEIILYSVDYASIYTARQSLSDMRICKRWREIIEHIKNKVSQIMEIDISHPVIIFKHDCEFRGFYWNRFRVDINIERSDMEIVRKSEWDLEISNITFGHTWNSLILIRGTTAVIYKESLNRIDYKSNAPLEDIIADNHISIIETSIGVRLEIADSENPYFILFLNTGQCCIMKTITINIASFTVLYDYIIFHTNNNKVTIIDHKTKTVRDIEFDWNGARPIMSCGDSILLNNNSSYLSVYSVSKGYYLRRFIKRTFSMFCNDSVLCGDVLYHFYTDSFIRVGDVEAKHIFKYNLKYYIVA